MLDSVVVMPCATAADSAVRQTPRQSSLNSTKLHISLILKSLQTFPYTILVNSINLFGSFISVSLYIRLVHLSETRLKGFSTSVLQPLLGHFTVRVISGHPGNLKASPPHHLFGRPECDRHNKEEDAPDHGALALSATSPVVYWSPPVNLDDCRHQRNLVEQVPEPSGLTSQRYEHADWGELHTFTNCSFYR